MTLQSTALQPPFCPGHAVLCCGRVCCSSSVYQPQVRFTVNKNTTTSKALTQSYTKKLKFALGLDNICKFLLKLNYFNVLLYKLKSSVHVSHKGLKCTILSSENFKVLECLLVFKLTITQQFRCLL